MLEITALGASYGAGMALNGVSVQVGHGELLVVLGRNGSGRSTLLRALVGQVVAQGDARLDGQSLIGRPAWSIARLGVGYAPDTREVFPALTVDENLRVAEPRAQWCDHAGLMQLFEPLRSRRRVCANRLSGGEQKLLSIARAALAASRMLLLDEPFEGLAAPMCEAVRTLIAQARRTGTIVLATDGSDRLLAADVTRVLLLGAGEVQYCGAPEGLAAKPELADWFE